MQKHWNLLGAVLLLGAIDVTSSYNVWKLARANGNFAFALYNKVIVNAAGQNVFFSPFRCVTYFDNNITTIKHSNEEDSEWTKSKEPKLTAVSLVHNIMRNESFAER